MLIIDYINLNKTDKIHGICGLSIGAQIVVEMLSINPNLSENWLIESAKCWCRPRGVKVWRTQFDS